MARSKMSNQGELMIDHRNSPGITPEFLRANNLGGPAVGAGRTFESGILNCRHCGTDVLLHQDRTRDREWCGKCDAYICDNCGLLRKLAGYEHKTAQEQISDIFERYQRSF